MQGLIEKYNELERVELAMWATIERIEPKNTIDSRAWRRDITMNLAKRGIISGIIGDLRAAAVSIDAALDTSAAKLRRVEVGRLTWQSRAERLQESLNDANAQIEDLQDAVDCGAPSRCDSVADFRAAVGDVEETAVFGKNPLATADAVQRITQSTTSLILLASLTEGAEEEATIHEILLTIVNDLDDLKETIEEATAAPQRDESDGGEDCPHCGRNGDSFEGLDWVFFCENCNEPFLKADARGCATIEERPTRTGETAESAEIKQVEAFAQLAQLGWKRVQGEDGFILGSISKRVILEKSYNE